MYKKLHLSLWWLFLFAVSTVVFSQQPDKATAQLAFENREYKKAVSLLKSVVKKDRVDANVWELLGASYLQLGNRKEGAKAYEKAVALQPDNDQYLAILAYVYLWSREQRAQTLADTALKINRQNKEAHYVLGVLNYRDQMYAAAYARAKAAIGIDPSFAAGYRLKYQSLVASFLAISGKVLPPATRGDLMIEAAQDAENFLRLASPDLPRRKELEEELASLKYYATYYSLPENRVVRDVTLPEPADPAVTPLQFISKPRPTYTDKAREAGISGTVRLLVAFDKSGSIGPILVIQSLDDGLDQAAITAAKAIKFRPPMRAGSAFSTVKTVEYSFMVY